MAHRSIPHATTDGSPAQLLFWREIRTKIPSLIAGRSRTGGAADRIARDNDACGKQRGKDYADHQRNAKESHFERGDQVLLKQPKEGKLNTFFALEQYKVVSMQDYQQLFREMSQCSLPSERRKSSLWQSLIDSSIDLTTSS